MVDRVEKRKASEMEPSLMTRDNRVKSNNTLYNEFCDYVGEPINKRPKQQEQKDSKEDGPSHSEPVDKRVDKQGDKQGEGKITAKEEENLQSRIMQQIPFSDLQPEHDSGKDASLDEEQGEEEEEEKPTTVFDDEEEQEQDADQEEEEEEQEHDNEDHEENDEEDDQENE